LKTRYSLFGIVISLIILIVGGGCSSKSTSPKELLDKYFSSAVKQDYETTYSCYYGAYKAKINKDEYIKHRKEASALQSYKLISLTQQGDTAHAEVLLTFAPSEKLKRTDPVSTTVKEDLIKENGEWKIKVW
jgi:divalent metal cation (Fe/Co/Zn/Cd) transporter